MGKKTRVQVFVATHYHKNGWKPFVSAFDKQLETEHVYVYILIIYIRSSKALARAKNVCNYSVTNPNASKSDVLFNNMYSTYLNGNTRALHKLALTIRTGLRERKKKPKCFLNVLLFLSIKKHFFFFIFLNKLTFPLCAQKAHTSKKYNIHTVSNHRSSVFRKYAKPWEMLNNKRRFTREIMSTYI